MSIHGLPDGYKEMLKDFTIAVITSKPKDVHKFAAEYFAKLSGGSTSCGGNKDEDSDSVMDTDEFSDPAIKMPERVGNRRKSVAAERYDPEEEDDDYVKPCHPKTDQQREILRRVCGKILLFNCLDEDQMEDVIDAMFQKTVEPKETIITEGENGDNFYVIVNGKFDVLINNNKVIEYDSNGSFGELALMYNTPRAATVISTTAGELYGMDRETFRCIVLKSAYQKRQIFENLLESVSILKSLSPYERLVLSDSLKTRVCQDGEQIIKQGEAGQEMFFIESGVVRVLMREHQQEREISRLEKCSYFGELALITRKPRAASAYAVGKVRLAVLEVSSFERLLGPCLDVMKRNVDHYKNQIDMIFHNEDQKKKL